MDIFSEWCSENCLDLNASKTKELVIDFHRGQFTFPKLVVNGQAIESVEAYTALQLSRDSIPDCKGQAA
ncbi:hypothetical protein SKAU_G00231980 [Synaphobranchus kaupii]|uniref:Uncharacterized protein n=1 Tax=Synaphobranchus kaupii TaxID=118154 RepID=A0A9Q1F5S2_SYNKA|nr:hypothetical protein SKAU_G00231980 [Synaphobranchus kaupii]